MQIRNNMDEISQRLYLIRFFAICTVVLAHTNGNEIANAIDYYIIKRLASVGVFVFFFIGGYFHKTKKTAVLIKDLTFNLILPWLALGSFNYFIGALKSGEVVSITQYVKYILGSGSMYYYCSIYVVIKFIMNYVSDKCRMATTINIILVVVTIVSTIVSEYISESIEWLTGGFITPYLNPFNWIGIFALGKLVRTQDCFTRFSNMLIYKKVLVICASILIVILGYFDCAYGYFGHLSFLCELSFFVIAFQVSSVVNLDCAVSRFVQSIGRNTLLVYFLHYPLLSILQKSQLLNGSIFIILIRCIICVTVIGIAGMLVSRFCEAFPKYNFLKIVLGLK